MGEGSTSKEDKETFSGDSYTDVYINLKLIEFCD